MSPSFILHLLSANLFESIKKYAEMGQLFQMDYSAVSRVAKRFEQENKVNHEIGEAKQKMITALKEN